MTSFGETANLEGRALRGDSEAQFQLARLLNAQGRGELARQWLERAAAAGHAEATCVLGCLLLDGATARPGIAGAVKVLMRACALGSATAHRQVAVLMATGAVPDATWAQAVDHLLSAATLGDAGAIRQLATIASLIDPDHETIAPLLLDSARRGDGLGAFAVLRRAAGGQTAAGGTELMGWKAHLEAAAHPLVGQLQIAGDLLKSTAMPDRHDAPLRADAKSFFAQGFRSVPPKEQLSSQPNVWRIRGLFTQEECDYIVGISRPQMAPSFVFDAATGTRVKSQVRTSSTASLHPYRQELALHAINLRIAEAAGIAPECGEMLSILWYKAGEEFRPHFDFLGQTPTELAELGRAGQRVATLLVYLNDAYLGGETVFLTNGLTFKGSIGEALLFQNVLPDGTVDRTTRHAGRPVATGNKWLASKWFRAREYPLV
ncbi:MAG: 2OG-Fe(II) oxygenase [Alphaproteobacteria bacterium]|nr:2OG-Fe(II) oxygenase [Alphaproteobacteria bacterium]